jgi:glucose-1-phosphate thymidylyltransferase
MCSSIRQFLDEQHDTDAPGYFIAWLVQRGPVFGVTMPGGWYDIGTVEAYQAACREWQRS